MILLSMCWSTCKRLRVKIIQSANDRAWTQIVNWVSESLVKKIDNIHKFKQINLGIIKMNLVIYQFVAWASNKTIFDWRKTTDLLSDRKSTEPVTRMVKIARSAQ